MFANVRFRSLLLALAGLALIAGCKRSDSQPNPSTTGASGATKVRLTLDWKPEPEFGGFYQARQDGTFGRHGLDVDVRPAGAGATMWQLVDSGQTEFATTAADQVLVARESGRDIVALFAVYQTSPQAIMVHKARGFSKIDDVFSHPGTLAAEDNPWLRYLTKKFNPIQVTVTSYSGGIGPFLAKPDYSQQCFLTSEPIQAGNQGGDPQTFLIAEAGYNPYTTVVIAKGDYVKKNPDATKGLVAACREGWRAYLDDPARTNASMLQLNKDMDAQTFTDAAAAQKPLIETAETKQNGLGSMTRERWDTLGQQLVSLGVLKNAPPGGECFVDFGTAPTQPATVPAGK